MSGGFASERRSRLVSSDNGGGDSGRGPTYHADCVGGQVKHPNAYNEQETAFLSALRKATTVLLSWEFDMLNELLGRVPDYGIKDGKLDYDCPIVVNQRSQHEGLARGGRENLMFAGRPFIRAEDGGPRDPRFEYAEPYDMRLLAATKQLQEYQADIARLKSVMLDAASELENAGGDNWERTLAARLRDAAGQP